MTSKGWKNMTWEGIQRDLWSVMSKLTEGESKAKIMKESWGKGVRAYQMLHWYHTKQSGMALNERMRRVLRPNPVKKEEDLDEAIGAWKRALPKN